MAAVPVTTGLAALIAAADHPDSAPLGRLGPSAARASAPSTRRSWQPDLTAAGPGSAHPTVLQRGGVADGPRGTGEVGPVVDEADGVADDGDAAGVME